MKNKTNFKAGHCIKFLNKTNPAFLLVLILLSGFAKAFSAIVTANGIIAEADTSINISKSYCPAHVTLSGSYTINKTLPTSGTNFNSFADFSSALTSTGVSGNVTATVVSGTGPYNEQVIFQNISGIGAGATVTIQGNGETITSDTAILSGGSNPNRHIIRLIDLQYFNINNLHVNMFAGSTAFIGIHILNSGNHISITNCVVNMGTGTSTLLGAIAATGSPSSLLAVGNFNNLTITGNSTMAGGYGVVCYGASNTTSISNIINNNTISGSNTNGIYVQNNGGLIISGNTVNFSASNGIQVAGAGNINTLVEKNFISCTNPTITNTLRGLYIFGSNPASPNRVVNNVIRNMNAPAASVIGITNRTSGAEFYFNTIILDGASATGTVSLGFDEDLSNLGSLLRNNIFYITRNSANYGAALALSSSSSVTSSLNSNYNVFYTANGAQVAVRKGIVFTNPPNNSYLTLANWQAASGQDANSLQTDPLFQSGTAIPQSGVINGNGIAIAGITTDITGAVRSVPPDPGAYEFTPPGSDAAITAFILPPIPHCSTTLAVQFQLTNAGANPLNTVTINWMVNGVPQTVVNWTGPPLASGASTIVTLGTVPVTGSNLYNFTATASNPNGGPDPNPSNDSFTYNGFRRGLEGAITINSGAPPSSTNYQSFQTVATALSQHGVCSPVAITVMNGPYNEQVVFSTIPGTSAANTVTLDGNNQTLNYNPADANNDYILQLNGINYTTVKNLTVNSLHPTQGRGIHITNGASKIVIQNNTVNVSLANNSSSSFGIIISGANWLLDGSLSDSVIINGNTVSGGYSGIQLSGVHWTQPLTRIKVTNNTILDWYGFGVYLSYTSNAIVSKNIIRRPLRTNSGSDAVTPAGITVPAGSLGFILEKNRIYDLHVSMPQSSTISRGIYMSGTTTAPTSGSIQNNLIYGMNNDGAQYGIQNNSVTGPVNIYHNTIVLNNATGAGTSNTDAINLSNFSSQSGIDIRNNIFYVTRGGTGAKRIIDVETASTSFISNYNATWLNAPGGTQTYGQIGSTNYITFNDWQTQTGKDMNSVFADPVFTNPASGNFTPTNMALDGATLGTSSVGVTDDILDILRSTNPDPGAYEFVPTCAGAVGGTASTSSGPFCTSGSGIITATGYSTGGGSGYQWQYSNDNFVADIHDLTGQTNPASAATGTISSTTYYRLKVTCTSGTTTAYSNIVMITVNQPVSVTTHPVSQSVCSGSNVTFIVIASGNILTYQWRKGGNNITGATNASYTIAAVVAGDAGNYDVVISGPCGTVISNTAVLSINVLTTISVQPASQALCTGSNVTFSVTANGAALSYQWRKNGNNISGATSSFYSISNLSLSDEGNYDVVVSGACGNATSSTAILTVIAGGTWIGVISSDWNTSGNWCAGIPASTSDILIPASAPNMPNLSGGTGNARNITIDAGASLVIGTGGTLNIYGNVMNSGIFNAASGNLEFRGAASQSIPAFTAINVTMNGTGGVLLGGNASVTGLLTLINGNISLGSNNLALSNSSTGSGFSHIITSSSGVVIVVNMLPSTSRLVPVGPDAGSYNPVILAANAGHTADNFTVAVQTGVLSNGTSGSLYTSHVVNRTWLINEEMVGGSDINITLQWKNTDELPGFTRNTCYIMKYNGGTWQIPVPGTAAGTDPYTQSRLGVTTFSPFAVRTTPVPRPSTGIYPNPASTILNVVLDLPDTGPITFSIYDGIGRLVSQTQSIVNAGLSQTTLNVEKLSAGLHTLRVSTSSSQDILVQKFIKINQ